MNGKIIIQREKPKNVNKTKNDPKIIDRVVFAWFSMLESTGKLLFTGKRAKHNQIHYDL
jgi:hypothetical protein